MKKNHWFFALVGAVLLIFVSHLNVSVLAMGSKPKVAPRTDTQNKTADEKTYLVTFVELGSVNCIPCKMMQPVMEEIEKEYGAQVRVVFHDVWTPEGRPFGEHYRIRAIPTQVFLDKDGKEFFRHTGFFPKEEIVKVLKKQGVN